MFLTRSSFLRRFALIALLASLACSTAAAAETTADRWFSTTIDGKLVGYVHETVTKETEDGIDVLVTEMATRFTIERMGTKLDVRSEASYVETVAGSPIRFKSVSKLAANDYEISAERKGDYIMVTQNSMGTRSQTEVPFSDDILFPAAMERKLRTTGLKPGQTTSMKTFSPDFARPTRVTVACLDFEEVSIGDGPKERLLRCKSTQDLAPNLSLLEWRAKDGEVRRSMIPLLGIEIVSVRSTREEALAETDSVELLVSTLVDPGDILPHPRKLTRAVFRLEFGDAVKDGDIVIPEDDRQRIIDRGPHHRTIEIINERWKESARGPAPTKAYREPSSVLQSDHAKVIAVSKEAGGDGDAETVAKRISRWVYASIKKKSLSVGLATAAEVAENLEGDCTEHAVLAAALARSRHIPSQVAMGLVYLNGVFGYHMWTEVYDKGWHAIDPALGQMATDATHIKLAESNLSQGFVDGGLLSLVSTIANLSIKIVEYDFDGHTLKPGSAHRQGRILEGVYSNSLFGISLKAPAGWKLVPRTTDSSRHTLVNLQGPNGSRGELTASTMSYDFKLTGWLSDNAPRFRAANETMVTVAKKPARRFLVRGAKTHDALLTFYDRETLFALELNQIDQHVETTVAVLAAAIELQE